MTVTSPSPSPNLLDETLRAASELVDERLEVMGDAFEAGVLARATSLPESRIELDYVPGQLGTAATEWARLATALDVDVPEVALRLARAVETTYLATDVPPTPAFTRGTFR